MTYKPEIDGLRAIAVLLVLLCHMQLGVPGGFVGVDIFFVISGYLITSIIYNEMKQKRFSFITFYGKRFARLYPALIVISALTFVAGMLIADPVYFENLARTARYAITSTANLYFNAHTGYFALDAQKQPFLHTWSLGVEWQFYLIWPIIMGATFKLTQKKWVLVAILILIALASLYGSQWATVHAPHAAYYQMHFRAFELAIGGLLVFGYHKELKPLPSALLMAAGLGAILFSSFAYTPFTPFPSYAALIPCLGAAACMFGGKGFTKGNFLRHPWVVFIGKSSYSVYLMHWPMLVLYKYYIYRDIVFTEKIILLLLSLVLGAILYNLVEKRINWRSMKNKLKGCSVMLAVTMSLVGLFMYTNKFTEGMPWRAAHQELLNDNYLDWGGKGFLFTSTLGNAQGKTIALMSGDSFAGSLAVGIDDALKSGNENIQMMFYPGCFISEIDERSDVSQACKDTSKDVIAMANEKDLPLILVESWGTSVILEERGIASLSYYKTPETYKEFVQKNLDDVHAKIGGKPLFLVSSVPYRVWGESDLECLMRPAFAAKACLQQLKPYNYQLSPINPYNVFLKEYAQTHDNVFYIETALGACPQGICTPDRNAKLYYDGFHTSVYGSKEVAPHVVSEVLRILSELQP